MWRKPQRGGAAYHLETIHQMNEPNESSGKGFGWAVLLFGAVWLSGAAVILVKFRLASDGVLGAFAAVTLIWAAVSLGMILTGYSPRRR